MKRVLLDNCVDRRFGAFLVGYQVVHILDLGWDRMADVTLVKFAAEDFDVLVTVDRNMAHQVNLKGLDLAVVVLRVPTNRLKDCLQRVADLLDALPMAMAGEFIDI